MSDENKSERLFTRSQKNEKKDELTLSQERNEELNTIEKMNMAGTVCNKPSCSKERKMEDVENNSDLSNLIKLLTLKYANEENHNPMPVENVENTIPDYNGDTSISVKRWFENFEKGATAYNWSEMQMFVFARNKMKKTAL